MTSENAARRPHLAARRRGYAVMVADAMSSDSHTRAGTLEHRLFEVVPDPLVVTSTDGRILRANPAACAMAGRDEQELLASSWWDLIHPADHAAVAAQQEETSRNGGTGTPFRCLSMRPGGSSRWVESSSTLDAEHGLIYSVVRDITGREDLELERLA